MLLSDCWMRLEPIHKDKQTKTLMQAKKLETKIGCDQEGLTCFISWVNCWFKLPNWSCCFSFTLPAQKKTKTNKKESTKASIKPQQRCTTLDLDSIVWNVVVVVGRSISDFVWFLFVLLNNNWKRKTDFGFMFLFFCLNQLNSPPTAQ